MAGVADKVRQLLTRPAYSGNDRDGDPPQSRQVRSQAPGPHWAEQDPDLFDLPQRHASQKARPRDKKQPFVTPYYIWGTLAVVMAGIASGALYWHVRVTEADEPVPDSVAYTDPLLPLEKSARTALLNPAPELSAELKRSFMGKPDALCKELQSLGLENGGWRRAPFQRGRWQCASDLVPLTTPSVDYGGSTLFFLLRGPSQDKVDYLRLKLVVEDPRQKQIGLDGVWLVIDVLAGRYGWTVPDAFRDAIADFDELETMQSGVRLSVAPEDPDLTGDPMADQRLNIIMNFGEPDLIRPADQFEKAPPLGSGRKVKSPAAQAEE